LYLLAQESLESSLFRQFVGVGEQRFVPVHLCNTKRNLLDIICLACTNWTNALLLDVIPCVSCAFGCIHTLDETTATMITTLHQTLGVTAHVLEGSEHSENNDVRTERIR
jgi:hypothetical protein